MTGLKVSRWQDFLPRFAEAPSSGNYDFRELNVGRTSDASVPSCVSRSYFEMYQYDSHYTNVFPDYCINIITKELLYFPIAEIDQYNLLNLSMDNIVSSIN